MHLDPIAEALYQQLLDELPDRFVYHTAEAVRAQAILSLELGLAAGLPESHRQAICWALIGCTLGWLIDYVKPETEAPKALARRLEALQAPTEPAELALRLLHNLHQAPEDPTAQVLADAQAAELASEELYLRWAGRHTEWDAANQPRPLAHWYADLHDRVARATYYTPAARDRFEAGRLARLAELRQLLGKD